MTKEVFVFVVCGSKEHTDTLHFSLGYLKHFTSKSIVVITDLSRNEEEIQHDVVVDVTTPSNLNHHQASIYLKTGIHKFLPKGNLYCYLDTDVIAVDFQCNQIFKEYVSPITFAPDHCRVQAFSAYAVNCGCLERCASDREAFLKSLKKHNKNGTLSSPEAKKNQKKIDDKYHEIQKSFSKKIFYAFRYYLSFPKFWLDKDIYFDKKRRLWATKSGEVVKYELNVKAIAKEANLRYTLWFNEWKNKKGERIFKTECNHLTQAISSTFQVEVQVKNWQHWNGGVFLFSDESADFLQAWHAKTIRIFNLPEWKTRDQGTLIATAWEFELQNKPTLGKQWNFIADFHNHKLALNKETNTLSDNLFETNYQPNFVHIFHQWKNSDWEIWKWVESKLK